MKDSKPEMPKKVIRAPEKITEQVSPTSSALMPRKQTNTEDKRQQKLSLSMKTVEKIVKKDTRKVEIDHESPIKKSSQHRNNVRIKRKVTTVSKVDSVPSGTAIKRVVSSPRETDKSYETRIARLSESVKVPGNQTKSPATSTIRSDSISFKISKRRETDTNAPKSERKISLKSLPPLKPLKKTIKNRIISKLVPAIDQNLAYTTSKSKTSLSSRNTEIQKISSSRYNAAKSPKTPRIDNKSGQSCTWNQFGTETSSRECRSSSLDRPVQKVQAFDSMSDRSSPVWSESDMSEGFSYRSDGIPDTAEQCIAAEMPCEAMEVDDVEFMERTIFKQVGCLLFAQLLVSRIRTIGRR